MDEKYDTLKKHYKLFFVSNKLIQLRKEFEQFKKDYAHTSGVNVEGTVPKAKDTL